MSLVAGGRGSGKSTLARSLALRRPRLVVMDPLDDYGGAGFAVARSIKAAAHGLRQGWAGGFRIRYVPPPGREPEALDALSRLLLRAQRPYQQGRDRRPLCLVAEEMQLSFPNRTLPAELTSFPELCSRGRHFGIEVIGVTQRLAEVHTRFRGNAEVHYYLRPDDHRDVTAACAKIGPQHRERLLALRNFEYLRAQQGIVTAGRVPSP